jgi:hypothetical protein
MLGTRDPHTVATEAGRAPKTLQKHDAAFWWLLIYLASALAVAVQRTLFSPENNFLILRTASKHLITGQDLYAAYPEIHADFFKYSPTFALLWGPFAVLQPVLGYMMWAVACVSALYVGITRALPRKQATLALALSWLAVFARRATRCARD